MLELGELSREAHEELGRLAAESDLYCLVTYGENAKRTAVVAAAKGVKTLHANNYREAADALLNRIRRRSCAKRRMYACWHSMKWAAPFCGRQKRRAAGKKDGRPPACKCRPDPAGHSVWRAGAPLRGALRSVCRAAGALPRTNRARLPEMKKPPVRAVFHVIFPAGLPVRAEA